MTEAAANCSIYPSHYVPVLTIETTTGNIDPLDAITWTALSGVEVCCSPALRVTIGCSSKPPTAG